MFRRDSPEERGAATIKLPPTETELADHKIYALILAAGQSRRMGRPKQMLPFGDATMIEAVVGAVLESSVDGLVVVGTPRLKEFLAGALPERCHFAVNDEPRSEMLTSAKIGLRRLKAEFDPAADDGVLVLLGDQPQVTGGLITTLAEAFRLPRRPPGILIATYRGRHGHPVVFRIDLFSEIADWPDDRGLNELARLHPESARELPITICPMPLDVNTPEDYKWLTGDVP